MPTCKMYNAPLVFRNGPLARLLLIATPPGMAVLGAFMLRAAFTDLAGDLLRMLVLVLAALFLVFLSAVGWMLFPWRNVEIAVRQDGLVVDHAPEGRRFVRWDHIDHLRDVPLAEVLLVYDVDGDVVFAADYAMRGFPLLREIVSRRLEQPEGEGAEIADLA